MIAPSRSFIVDSTASPSTTVPLVLERSVISNVPSSGAGAIARCWLDTIRSDSTSDIPPALVCDDSRRPTTSVPEKVVTRCRAGGIRPRLSPTISSRGMWDGPSFGLFRGTQVTLSFGVITTFRARLSVSPLAPMVS